MKEKVKYSDLIKLGFERYEMNDRAFFDENGYDDFIMEFKIKNIWFVWFPEEKTVYMRHIKKHDILASMELAKIEQVRLFIEFFKAKDNTQFKLKDYNMDYTMYA